MAVITFPILTTQKELADYAYTSDVGPTGVVSTYPGSVLADFGSLTTRAVPHWLELAMAIGSNAAGAVAFLLVEGPGATPGTTVGQVALWTAGSGATSGTWRLRFTPVAGTRNYHLRWVNLGGSTVTYTIYAGSFMNFHASIREV